MKFWFSLLVMAALPASAADDSVLVFGDDNYPPVIWAEKGEARGELPRILKALEPALGQKFRFELSPWRRAYESAAAGRGALIGVSLTSERQKLFDFSDPVYDDNINVVVLRGREFAYRELHDLRGKKLGGQLGASYGEAFDRALQSGDVAVERAPTRCCGYASCLPVASTPPWSATGRPASTPRLRPTPNCSATASVSSHSIAR